MTALPGTSMSSPEARTAVSADTDSAPLARRASSQTR